jgi:uncharacterized membrane protein YkvI
MVLVGGDLEDLQARMSKDLQACMSFLVSLRGRLRTLRVGTIASMTAALLITVLCVPESHLWDKSAS